MRQVYPIGILIISDHSTKFVVKLNSLWPAKYYLYISGSMRDIPYAKISKVRV